jgi:hypothetical protein
VPLSEQEQRLLEEMERSLYQNDADFVATVGNRGGRRNYRTIVVGILVALLGIAAVIAGVVLQLPVIGIVGFVVMFVGVLVALAPPKSGASPTASSGSASASSSRGGQTGRPQSGQGFMDRLNDRWDRRQGDQDR